MIPLQLLVVEDRPERVALIEESISETVAGLGLQLEIAVASDLISAKRELGRLEFDIAIIDVHVPKRFGQAADPMGGPSLITEIDANVLLKKPRYIIGFTEHVDEIPALKRNFINRFYELVGYSRDSLEWRVRLHRAISDIAMALRSLHVAQQEGRRPVSLAVICALESPELTAVLSLPGHWKTLERNSDCTVIHEGRIKAPSGEHVVIATSALEPGMAASGALCAKIISEFRPRYLAMTGIAGGVRGVTRLGDIVAADVVWDYSSGKIIEKRGKQSFLPEPRTIDLDAKVKSQMMRLVKTEGLIESIQHDFKGKKPQDPLQVIFGPMFTGSAVIANGKFVTSLEDMHRKIKGIDMEAYSVMCAAKYAGTPEPIPIVLKSVSDFADPHKNDDYHEYASYTSARMLFEWAIRYL